MAPGSTMGQTTGAQANPDAQQGQPNPEEEDPWGDPNDNKQSNPEGEDDGNKNINTDLEYDPEAKKYFNPYTGEYVVTPGHYEPPPPPPKPLRVKVRKRDHRRLRKKRRPPQPIPITPTPTPPPQPPQPPIQYDEYGYPIEPEYDEYGNLVEYDEYGYPIEYDEYGNPIERDELGYPIEYDEYGQPVTPEYQYDEYGNPIPYNPYPIPPPEPKKKEKLYRIPDDGYDYDHDTYTWTTVESTLPRSPTPESSDEVQEKDDSGDESMEEVDDFHWRPFVPVMPKDEARALLKTGGEYCSCFPRRSDSNIPSMVYDKITCPHNNNVMGHAHPSVYRFNDNWEDKYTKVRRLRRPNRHRSKVAQVWGYPDLHFPLAPKGTSLFQGGLRGEFQMPPTAEQDSRTAQGSKPRTTDRPEGSKAGSQGKGADPSAVERTGSKAASQRSKPGSKAGTQDQNADDKGDGKPGSKGGGDDAAKTKDDAKSNKDTKSVAGESKKDDAKSNKDAKSVAAASTKLSREKMEPAKMDKKGDKSARAAQTSRASIVEKRFFPRIGYTPDNPFGDADRDGTPKDDKPESQGNKPSEIPTLPPIPASPASSTYSRTSVSREFQPRPEIKQNRQFQGKYYDSVTNKTYTYDIKPNWGRRMDQWTAQRN